MRGGDMPRARDPNRDKAYEIYKKHKGKIQNREISKILKVPEKTVSGWKCKDKWNEKMNGVLQNNTEYSEQKNNSQRKAGVEEVRQVIENPELTDKQRLFCIYYVRCFNATKAYQKAYQCGYETAMANGSTLLRNTKIKSEINSLKQNRLNREFLSEEDIFQKYMDIAFADITDYVSFGTEEVPVMSVYGPVEIKNSETGEKEILKQIANVVRFKDSTEIDGTILAEVKQGRDGASIKLADRMKALQWLTDHMNMATEEQKAKVEQMKARTEQIQHSGNNNESDAVQSWMDAVKKARESNG
ncbi:MAG: terminase small subunit [Anaerostipes hadrus]